MTQFAMLYQRETGEELEFLFTCTYIPGRPAVWNLRNGDPGYPEEPAEIEDIEAFLTVGGKTVQIQDWEKYFTPKEVCDTALEQIAEDNIDEEDL